MIGVEEQVHAYDEKTDIEVENKIVDFLERYYQTREAKVDRIRHNIWNIRDQNCRFNIIVTSLLIIFDTILFEKLPEKRSLFFEELLILNSHHTRSSKLCLVNHTIHLRIIRGLEGLDYQEFIEHIEEFKEIFPEIRDLLSKKYYPVSAK